MMLIYAVAEDLIWSRCIFMNEAPAYIHVRARHSARLSLGVQIWSTSNLESLYEDSRV